VRIIGKNSVQTRDQIENVEFAVLLVGCVVVLRLLLL
jgi:hypothetical protein